MLAAADREPAREGRDRTTDGACTASSHSDNLRPPGIHRTRPSRGDLHEFRHRTPLRADRHLREPHGDDGAGDYVPRFAAVLHRRDAPVRRHDLAALLRARDVLRGAGREGGPRGAAQAVPGGGGHRADGVADPRLQRTGSRPDHGVQLRPLPRGPAVSPPHRRTGDGHHGGRVQPRHAAAGGCTQPHSVLPPAGHRADEAGRRNASCSS